MTSSPTSQAASGQAQVNQSHPKVPSRYRMALLTLVGVYPLITAILYAVLPLTSGWPIWQVTLVVAPIMVAIMVFWMIPFIQKRFSRFILVPV